MSNEKSRFRDSNETKIKLVDLCRLFSWIITKCDMESMRHFLNKVHKKVTRTHCFVRINYNLFTIFYETQLSLMDLNEWDPWNVDSAGPSQVEILSGANSLEILVRNIKMFEFVLFWSLKFPKCPWLLASPSTGLKQTKNSELIKDVSNHYVPVNN